MCVQKDRGKVGLSGTILVKSNIPKSKFDVFEENLNAGFSNITIMGKIFGNF